MVDPTDDVDPMVATTGDELAACMRWLRARADNISYRELERWGELHDKPLPRTTLLEVLHGRRFPRKSVLLAFVEACGVDPTADPRWEQAWNRLNDELNFSDLSEPTVPVRHTAENLGDERVSEPTVPADVWEQAQGLIQQARLSASAIVANARDEARQLVERARAEAAAIKSAAEREAAQIKDVAVERAAREAEELRQRVLKDLAEEVDALERQLAGPPDGKDRQRPPKRGKDVRSRSWFGR